MSAMVFTALDGSNPLAFLAALGTLRLSSMLWSDCEVRMRWIHQDGWRAEISGIPVVESGDFCNALHEAPCWAPLELFRILGDDLTVPPEVFASLMEGASESSVTERRLADFAAAFGCEVISDPKRNRIEFTDLCFITGSGHQHFLGSAYALAESCTTEHLFEALFGPWRRANKSNSFRWDPEDAREYALLYNNPGPEGVRAVWGANRLAFEGLPLLPAIPTRRGLHTTGFLRRERAEEFTWPIWTHAATVDTVRSLLSLGEIQSSVPDRRSLAARGIAEVFRTQRVRIGQGANFKVSFRPARSV